MPTTPKLTDTYQSPPSAGLRHIGFIPLLAVFYGYTAGGPFGYEAIFKSSGPGMGVLFLAVVPFFWCVPIGLASAELNSILPVQGGFYRWSRAAFGDFWGFQCGWWNWTGTFLLNSLYGVMAMAYLADYLPWLHGYTKWAGACLVLCLLAYLNARGIQIAGWVSVALLIAVLIPVVWLCVVSVLHWHHDPLAPFMPPGKPFRSLFGEGLALAMWNYAGYEQLSSITGEMKDPQRDLVRVLAWNTPILIVTSIVPAAFALAVLGNWPDWETGYIVTASRLIGGQALGAAMLIGSLIGVLSLSNSTILYTTRIPATMAEDGYFPIWMGKLSRFGTPARAIATSLVVYCVLAKYRVEDLVNIYIWTRIATSLLTVFAVWGMRAKAPKMFRRFRIPGGPLGILYVIVFPVLLCVVKIYYSEPFVFRWAPLLLASGPVAYAVLRWGLGMTPVSQTGTAAK